MRGSKVVCVVTVTVCSTLPVAQVPLEHAVPFEQLQAYVITGVPSVISGASPVVAELIWA
jgi:hypothetical protein